MRAVLLAALPALLVLNAAIPSAAKAEGGGSAPATAPAFDPTGSHPLPNEGVEGRPPGVLPASGAPGAEGDGRSGCGCRVAGRARARSSVPGEPLRSAPVDAVAAMVAVATILVRRGVGASPTSEQER